MPFFKSLFKSLKKILLPKKRSSSRPKKSPAQKNRSSTARKGRKKDSRAASNIGTAAKSAKSVAVKPALTTSAKTSSGKSAKSKVKSQPGLPVKKNSSILKEEKLLIGDVTHYFPRIQVVVIKVTSNPINVGDEIMVEGGSKSFRQKVASLQIESVNVKQGKKGQLVGLKVAKEAIAGDKVYNIVK